MACLINGGLVYEFFDIFYSCLCLIRLFGFKFRKISRFFKNLVNKLFHGHCFFIFLKFINNGCEFLKLIACLSERALSNSCFECRIKAYSPLICKVRNRISRRFSYRPFRNIYDSFNRNIISVIVDGFQICKNVFYFFSLIEIYAPDNFIRNIFPYKRFFKVSRLSICSVKTCAVVIGESLAHKLLNLIYNSFRFHVRIIHMEKHYFGAFALVCPECLGLSVNIVFYDRICRIQYIFCRAVVLFKSYNLSSGKALFKA